MRGLLAAAKFSCQAIAMTLFSKHTYWNLSAQSAQVFLLYFYLLDSILYALQYFSYSFPHRVAHFLFLILPIANQNTSPFSQDIYTFFGFSKDLFTQIESLMELVFFLLAAVVVIHSFIFHHHMDMLYIEWGSE